MNLKFYYQSINVLRNTLITAVMILNSGTFMCIPKFLEPMFTFHSCISYAYMHFPACFCIFTLCSLSVV